MEVVYDFKAEDVIKECRITRGEINAIRRWIESRKEIPYLIDEQIVNFVLSCDRDLEFTKKTIIEYYKLRKDTTDLFKNRNIVLPELQQQLQALEFFVIPKRTPDGSAILYHKLHDHSYSKYNMGPAMKLLFMTLDVALRKHPPTGLITLFDMKGVGLGHLTRVKIRLVKAFFQYTQKCLPVKLKSMHVMNTVYFIDKVMLIVKPFLDPKLFEEMHFHQPNVDMEEFYRKYIPKECLPSDYGGDLPDARTLHAENTIKLEELTKFFEAEEHQRMSL